jgi:hypothetical protein
VPLLRQAGLFTIARLFNLISYLHSPDFIRHASMQVHGVLWHRVSHWPSHPLTLTTVTASLCSTWILQVHGVLWQRTSRWPRHLTRVALDDVADRYGFGAVAIRPQRIAWNRRRVLERPRYAFTLFDLFDLFVHFIHSLRFFTHVLRSLDSLDSLRSRHSLCSLKSFALLTLLTLFDLFVLFIHSPHSIRSRPLLS